jgi:activator of HSP90 ATPase
MATIHKSLTIDAPKSQVWQALTDPKLIEEWAAGKAKMDDQEGTEFSLWDGDIHGKNIKVDSQKELVQEWYSKDWDKPSIVKFILFDMKPKTILKLEHTNIPDKEKNSIDQGWDDYYLGPLKEYLEKGL